MSSQVSKNLRELLEPGGELRAALLGGLERACIGVEGAAKRRVPVRTATLRNSIDHDVRENDMIGYVGTSVPYAPYVEIGTGIYSSQGDGRQTPWIYTDPATGDKIFTRGSHPHPYLKPAVDENLSAILKCFEGII